jgi:predicted transcriptional regulator
MECAICLRRPGVQYAEGDAIPPANVTKRAVEEYAHDLAGVADFQPGDSPIELAERLGGRIAYLQMDEWLAENGSIFVHGEADFDITLPRYTSPNRDHFTVAHELGHYFLHSEQGQVPIIAYRQGSTRIEWEANWFAASLLMPRKAFRDAWKKHSNLAMIASLFGVSQDAAEVRRRALGI